MVGMWWKVACGAEVKHVVRYLDTGFYFALILLTTLRQREV